MIAMVEDPYGRDFRVGVVDAEEEDYLAAMDVHNVRREAYGDQPYASRRFRSPSRERSSTPIQLQQMPHVDR